MKVKLAANREKDTIMMRDVYSSTLISMAEQDERIVVLDADLMNSMSMKPCQAAFPERTFNCGVQEANMIGVAAGLSATGKIPLRIRLGHLPQGALSTRYLYRRHMRS